MKCALFLLTTQTLIIASECYDYERGPVTKSGGPYPCPGLYCGRSDLNETHFSGCGKCPRGWRVMNNTYSICQQCSETPNLYDWLYLAFYVVLVLTLHFFFIDYSAKRRGFNKEVLLCHFSAVLEVSISSVLSILVMEPAGNFELSSCRTQRLSDFYTYFHNPTPNYDEKLTCTQEAVYPIYSMVFMFFGFCGLAMLFMRPCLSSKYLPGRGRSAIYAALYFLPILSVIHAICGGLVYFAYPYLVLIFSVISSAAHFACKLDQSPANLLLGCFTETRNAVILVGHWALHGFGILALTQLKDPAMNLSLLSLTPLPALFYCLSAKFSDPAYFLSDVSS